MRSKKIMTTISLLVAIFFLLYTAYELYARITTGRPMSKLPAYYLLLTGVVGIWRVASIRRACRNDPAERKKFDKVFLRSVLIAILIVSFVVVAAALYAINRGPH